MSIQETSWTFGILTALLTLLSSVWYTSAAVNNKNRDVSHMRDDLVDITDALNNIKETLALQEHQLEDLDRVVKESLTERVKLLYVNSDHILLEAQGGRVIKVPMIKG